MVNGRMDGRVVVVGLWARQTLTSAAALRFSCRESSTVVVDYEDSLISFIRNVRTYVKCREGQKFAPRVYRSCVIQIRPSLF